jgi:hypothetical protein
VVEFRYWKAMLCGFLVWVPMAWLVHEVAAGRLPAEAGKAKLRLEGPVIVARKRLEEAEANQVLTTNRVMSVRTWRRREGLDDLEEEENLVGDSTSSYPGAGEEGDEEGQP